MLFEIMLALPEIGFPFFTLAFLVALIAGFVKGVTGFAMPMILVSGMAMFLDPRLAIAAIAIPTIVSNFWQAMQNGGQAMLRSLWRHRPLIGATLVMIYVNAQWVGRLDVILLLKILGFAIFFIALVQILGFRPKINPARQNLWALLAGAIAGFFGAIAGTWGPATVIYLLAIGTPKSEQTRVSGISFGLGAVVFWIAHQRSGLITPEALGLSIIILPPMIFGLWLGARANDRIDQETFRKAVLWVLLIAALNLLRRAYFG